MIEVFLKKLKIAKLFLRVRERVPSMYFLYFHLFGCTETKIDVNKLCYSDLLQTLWAFTLILRLGWWHIK